MSRNGHSPPGGRAASVNRRHEWGFGPGWSHWITFLLGLFLFVAPWAMGYARNMAALALSLFLGPLIAIFAFLGLIAEPEASWPRRIVFIAGLLAVAAPFVLGPDIPRTAARALIVLGGLSAVVSTAGMLTDSARRAI